MLVPFFSGPIRTCFLGASSGCHKTTRWPTTTSNAGRRQSLPVPFGHVSSFFLGGRGQQSPFPPGRLQAQREERLPDGPKLSTESGETLLAASWRASAIEFSLQDKKAAARHFKIAGEARLSSFHHWSNCFSPCVRATSQGKMG